MSKTHLNLRKKTTTDILKPIQYNPDTQALHDFIKGKLADLGKAIKHFREVRGESLRAFSDVVGIHQNNLSLIERGKVNISLKNLTKITSRTGLTLEVLWSQAENVTPSDKGLFEYDYFGKLKADCEKNCQNKKVVTVDENQIELLFGDNLKGLRTKLESVQNKHHWHLTDTASNLGVSTTVIKDIQNLSANIGIVSIITMCYFLDVSLTQFFFDMFILPLSNIH